MFVHRCRCVEDIKRGLSAQNEVLKRSNHELNARLSAEKQAKQREVSESKSGSGSASGRSGL